MFVLISNRSEDCCDGLYYTVATAFRTKDEAISAMRSEATACAGSLDGFETTWDAFMGVHGYFPDGCEWKVVEVPGAYIPQDYCDGFTKSIRAAADMYGDEERTDWYDADDMCRDICWELESLIDTGKE